MGPATVARTRAGGLKPFNVPTIARMLRKRTSLQSSNLLGPRGLYGHFSRTCGEQSISSSYRHGG
eukprot:5781900-Amphidinium_carterae.1